MVDTETFQRYVDNETRWREVVSASLKDLSDSRDSQATQIARINDELQQSRRRALGYLGGGAAAGIVIGVVVAVLGGRFNDPHN